MSHQTEMEDQFDSRLAANVRPADWQPPQPTGPYHLIVLGGGTAGLVTAAAAAGLGAKVALVERHALGGDCLNYGCVPSKALLRAARAAAEARRADEFGVRVGGPIEVDFSAVMTRMRRLRSELSSHDSAHRFRDLGVDVYLGEATFIGPDRITVSGQTLKFRRAVVATGTRARHPQTPGLREAGFLTNETVFSLNKLPRRLAVVGAGPIGCEMAQAFARFGSQVTLFARHGQILPKDDPLASDRVMQAFRRDGVDIRLNCEINRVRGTEFGKQLDWSSHNGDSGSLLVDEILVAIGRVPNVEGLGLEVAGVEYDPEGGIQVDDRLRTTNRQILAAGDICSPFKFTHAADAMARIAVQNALFAGRSRASALIIPWCTYTDPEVAHVGLRESDATSRQISHRVFVQELRQVDRARLDGQEDGFVKIITAGRSDRILGGTIVASHAGEWISEITLAIQQRLGLRAFSKLIHPYPTQAEALRKLGDAYQRTRLTPLVSKLARWWLNLGSP